ncbi:MAG: hypothetical protein Q9170_002124 [Blastenia crenularia]
MDAVFTKPAVEQVEPTDESCTDLEQNMIRLSLDMSINEQVVWNKDNPDHPRNWTMGRKVFDVGINIVYNCVASASPTFFPYTWRLTEMEIRITLSTAAASASEQATEDLHIGTSLSLFAFVSMYLIGQALGGAVLSAYTESFGRKRIFIASAFLYSLFCAITGAVVSLPSIFICRFITGLLSAIPGTVLAGSIEDMFDTSPRTFVVYAWNTGANLGLCLGPIMGAYVTAELNWRWNFYIVSILTGFIGCLMLAMRESRPSILLKKRVDTLKTLTGDTSLQMHNPDHMPDAQTFVQTGLLRPIKLLFTEPILFTVAIMTSVAYGLIYLFTVAMPIIYESFSFDARHASLAFIPIGLGVVLGLPLRFHDRRILRRKQEQGKAASPEDKLMGFILAAPALAVGLWWFSWAIPPMVLHVHWIVSMLPLVLVGFAVNEFDCVLIGYIGDSYTVFSASALAGMCLLRPWLSVMVPFFGTKLFTNLKPNIGGSILAAAATVFCVVPVVFKKYGERIRQASKFARYSIEVHNETCVDGGKLEVASFVEAGVKEGVAVSQKC